MAEKQISEKYIFKGMTIDNTFFKTDEDKAKFLRNIKESIRPFIEEHDRRKQKSYADSQFRIIY